jgi:hypothetical protein
MNEQPQDRSYNGVFKDEVVDVTGLTMGNPFFSRCTVERWKTADGEPSTQLWGAVFDHCVFTGDGWPDWWPKVSES